MPTAVLTDCEIYVDSLDFTTQTNQCELAMSGDVKDQTTFGSNGWRDKRIGLRSLAMSHKGFWDSAASVAVDGEVFIIFSAFPGLARVHTLAPYDDLPADPAVLTVEQVAWMFQAGQFGYKLLDGGIGEIAPFEVTAEGKNGVGVVRGVLVRPRANVSATGKVGVTLDTATGVASGQSLYGTLHIFSAGTTITIQVQSDDNTGFATPTTHQTLGPFTTPTATWITPIAGPITDRYFRLNVSAITGTFSVAAALGVR